jgi:phosphoglycerate-specific signal transduction histidine kinase
MPAYVSIRQHMSAYLVSVHQHTLAYVSIRQHTSASHSHSQSRLKTLANLGIVGATLHTSAYSIRQHATCVSTQHTSAYVSIRQHTSAYSIRQHTHTSAYVSIRQHTPAYVSIRQHMSAYVSIRRNTSALSAQWRAASKRSHLIFSRRFSSVSFLM